MLFREGRAVEEEISLQPSEGDSTYSASCISLIYPPSHKAFLCLAESTLNLERRKRNKYSKYWGSEEAKVSYVRFTEKQNFLVKLFQFSVFLLRVFVFFKKGVSCVQCVFSERATTQGLEKRDEMESKAQITNTHQTSEVQVQICTSDNCEGKNMKHCLGHSFQPWVGGIRVQTLQLIFLSEMVLTILKLGCGEVSLGSQ